METVVGGCGGVVVGRVGLLGVEARTSCALDVWRWGFCYFGGCVCLLEDIRRGAVQDVLSEDNGELYNL